jgi:hypothetical protein
MDAEVRISIWMFVSSSHSLGWKINPDVVLSLCRWALGTCKVERAPSAESRGRNCGMLDRTLGRGHVGFGCSYSLWALIRG